MKEVIYKDFINWIDLVLVPLYFFMIYGVFLIAKRLNPQNILIQKYLLKGYFFKVVGAIFYCLIIYYYYGFGDSLSYFRDALFIKQQIAIGNESFFSVLFADDKYIRETYEIYGGGSAGGWLVVRIALILSYISFSRFLIVTLFFATLAYSGLFKMFELFSSFMPEWHYKVALIVLFFPSLAVYGSGILKDTLCISALGWMVYCGNKMFTKKEWKAKYILSFLVSFIILSVVKVYILAAFLIPYFIYLLVGLVRKVPNPFFRRTLFPVLLLLIVLIYFSISQLIDEKLGNYAVEKLFDTVKEQQQSYKSTDAEGGSVFTMGTFEPTLSAFISKIPAGITATLYRPFLWESNKLIMIFTALESLIILIFTLYVILKAGILKIFRQIFSDRFVFLCICFSLLFSAIVGLSTLNFGTLARYRIPAIPFYLAGLLAILYKVKVVNPKKQPENIV